MTNNIYSIYKNNKDKSITLVKGINPVWANRKRMKDVGKLILRFKSNNQKAIDNIWNLITSYKIDIITKEDKQCH